MSNQRFSLDAAAVARAGANSCLDGYETDLKYCVAASKITDITAAILSGAECPARHRELGADAVLGTFRGVALPSPCTIARVSATGRRSSLMTIPCRSELPLRSWNSGLSGRLVALKRNSRSWLGPCPCTAAKDRASASAGRRFAVSHVASMATRSASPWRASVPLDGTLGEQTVRRHGQARRCLARRTGRLVAPRHGTRNRRRTCLPECISRAAPDGSWHLATVRKAAVRRAHRSPECGEQTVRRHGQARRCLARRTGRPVARRHGTRNRRFPGQGTGDREHPAESRKSTECGLQ
jgi:hypothetical protein